MTAEILAPSLFAIWKANLPTLEFDFPIRLEMWFKSRISPRIVHSKVKPEHSISEVRNLARKKLRLPTERFPFPKLGRATVSRFEIIRSAGNKRGRTGTKTASV